MFQRKSLSFFMCLALLVSLVAVPMGALAAGEGGNDTLPPYPGSLIQYGDRGIVVELVQNELNVRGYHAGPVDGIFGPLTRAAVLGFQEDNELTVDGIVGPETWGSLFALFAPAYPGFLMQYGDEGMYVYIVQAQLNAHDYDTGSTDGIFGPLTRAAVLGFQEDHELTVDGIVGPETWDTLFQDRH
jgi:peptidoglycan hydrolase-like protein with peptidoglycan-binding domain